jgi:uncharacterized membrane protein
LGAFLRFYGLNLQSFWYDELCSTTRAAPHLQISKIIKTYQKDPHPPFHPLLLHYWMKIFGYNQFSTRLLSAIFGIVGVFAFYLLGCEISNRRTGLITSMLAAVNYFHIYYSQEVRPYIFAALWGTLSFYFLLQLLREQNKKHLLLYAVSSTLMIYTHYYGLIMLLSHGVSICIYIIIGNCLNRKKIFIYYTLSGLLIAILYSPWIPSLVGMMKRKIHHTAVPAPSFFIDYFENYFGKDPYIVILFASII